MGYVFIGCSIFAANYSPIALLLIIPGLFMAFTYTGTIIDADKKRVRPYTSLFGLIRTGKWIETKSFSRFKIIRSNRRYTSYSRANIRFDMNVSDIRLLLLNSNGSTKVVLKRFNNIEDAQREMKELSEILSIQVSDC